MSRGGAPYAEPYFKGFRHPFLEVVVIHPERGASGGRSGGVGLGSVHL